MSVDKDILGSSRLCFPLIPPFQGGGCIQEKAELIGLQSWLDPITAPFIICISGPFPLFTASGKDKSAFAS